jgi:anaerobic magnesium-protoporphyrin IX monomethyl ester cyclase
MKRVLLIVPPLAKVVDLKALGGKWPRIGIAYIAAYLRDHGVKVGILDCKAEGLNLKEAVGKILAFQPDIIGITAFTEEILEAAEICQLVKKNRNDVLTVIGGTHASAIPIQTLEEFPEIDIVVYGEGEETLWEIVQAQDDGGLSKVNGIAYRNGVQIALNKPRLLIKNVDALPYPAWDLFPLQRYRGSTILTLGEKGYRNILELPILSMRGCPYGCNFCFHVYGTSARFRDYKKVVDEIQFNLENYDATQFFFADGTFGMKKENVVGMCKEIIARKINKKIKWTAPTRADVSDEETLKLMKESGCMTFCIGVESGDEEILRNSEKGETKEQIRKAVGLAKKIGLPIEASFVMGHPFETEESIKRTIDFARELDPDIFYISIMIPYPGTKVHEMAKRQEGNYKLLSKNWNQYTKQSGGPLELKNITLAKLRNIQTRAYLKYYLRPKKLLFILKIIPLSKAMRILADLLKNAVI